MAIELTQHHAKTAPVWGSFFRWLKKNRYREFSESQLFQSHTDCTLNALMTNDELTQQPLKTMTCLLLVSSKFSDINKAIETSLRAIGFTSQLSDFIVNAYLSFNYLILLIYLYVLKNLLLSSKIIRKYTKYHLTTRFLSS